MSDSNLFISSAHWVGPKQACIILQNDWQGAKLPSVVLDDALEVLNLRQAEASFFGEWSRYYKEGNEYVFVVDPSRYPHVDFNKQKVIVAGSFNDWGNRGSKDEWALQKGMRNGELVYQRSFPCDSITQGDSVLFKFCTEDWHWLSPDEYAPNYKQDSDGNCNYELRPHESGRHIFLFEVNKRALGGEYSLRFSGQQEAVTMTPGLGFYSLKTDLPMGVSLKTKESIFRLFAPRAKSVKVEVFSKLDASDSKLYDLSLLDDLLVWELRLTGNLEGSYYNYYVDGVNCDKSSSFDAKSKILDPWARATVSASGPAVIVDLDKVKKTAPKPCKLAPYHDLVMMECHIRDLAAKAPMELTADERLGFKGLQKYFEKEGSYLKEIGVNALELQPIQQFDGESREDYHWGYMTTNYFSPSAYYTASPEKATQLREFQELISSFHKSGIAVIIDVVYNHVGVPAYLELLDKQYYLHVESNGELSNWSGCGNTVRSTSAMARRLIIESLSELVEIYGVDGFRFDLGELIGVEVLKEAHEELKKLNPNIIFIAEPWSFRGSMALDLKETDIAFWNDGYREFMVDYVHAKADSEGLAYYIKGSMDHAANWPGQSINYVESHDDRCWLDKITENHEYDGRNPTHNDIARTHIMAAVLMSSLGNPMISAGQDFLRSKHGINNTYLMGDINALDYSQLEKHSHTHNYFKQWIRLRMSKWGELFRLAEKPSPDYIRFFSVENSSALVALYNNDMSKGNRHVLLAVNPHFESVHIPLNDFYEESWVKIADRDQLDLEGISDGIHLQDGHVLEVPGMEVALWVKEW